MSVIANLETLKEVIAGLEPYADTAVIDVTTGDTILSRMANEIDEQRKVLEPHKSTEEMAKMLEPIPTRIRHDSIVMRDVVQTLTSIVEIIERHEKNAVAKIESARETK
jgi:hypothetical protein